MNMLEASVWFAQLCFAVAMANAAIAMEAPLEK